MMNVMSWPSPILSNKKEEDGKLPWFLRTDFQKKDPVDDIELDCAEMLMCLKKPAPVPPPPSSILLPSSFVSSVVSPPKAPLTATSFPPAINLAPRKSLDGSPPSSAKVELKERPRSISFDNANPNRMNHSQIVANVISQLSQIPIHKSDMKGKKKIKRNTNPCPEHRRKHQRCPTTCPGRKKKDKSSEDASNHSSPASSGTTTPEKYESAPSSPIDNQEPSIQHANLKFSAPFKPIAESM